jgi:chromosome segregation ATPase
LRTITAAEALPGVVLLPYGITEADPTKALPLVIERLNGMQAEAERLRGELATKQSEFNTAEAYLKTVRAALDCNDDAQLAERAQRLQDVAAKTQKLQDDLSTTRTRLTASEREVSDLKATRTRNEMDLHETSLRLEEALADLKESQTAALSLQQDLAASVESRRLAEQGRDKAIADKNMMGGQYEAEFARATGHMQARVKLEEELEGALAHLKLANDSIESLQRSNDELGKEVDALTEEVGRLTPLLPLWARALFTVVGLAIVVAISHKAGFDAATAFRGGIR